MADAWIPSPRPAKSRPSRAWETSPDNYVRFEHRQAIWHLSYIHPRMFGLWRLAARIRCLFKGHEGSPWEDDKFVPNPGRQQHCVYCGKVNRLSAEDVTRLAEEAAT